MASKVTQVRREGFPFPEEDYGSSSAIIAWDRLRNIFQDYEQLTDSFIEKIVAGAPLSFESALECTAQLDLAWYRASVVLKEYNSGKFGQISEEYDSDSINESVKAVNRYCHLLFLVTNDAICRTIGKEGHVARPISVDDRLVLLEMYAKRHGGRGVADYAKILLPELSSSHAGADVVPALPHIAPENWKDDKRSGETPPDFIRRVYSTWLGHGLDRAHIRKLDKPLWQALYNWLRHHEMPPDIDLPTRAAQNTRWVDRVEQEGIAALADSPDRDAPLAQLRRLEAASRRRPAKTEK